MFIVYDSEGVEYKVENSIDFSEMINSGNYFKEKKINPESDKTKSKRKEQKDG